MKKKILGRLEALERKRIDNQESAEQECFFNHATLAVLAYFVGELKPKECVWEGFARALGFRGCEEFCGALHQAVKDENGSELTQRGEKAVGRLFSQFGYDRSSPEAFKKAITKMANQLPVRWRAWIAREVNKVDYDEQIRQKQKGEALLRKLEQMAAAEARVRRR